MVDTVALAKWCSAGSLPNQDDLFAALVDETDEFTHVEGQQWDFKDQWPFSYSDRYFAGICRLICALSNSNGGVIVFGVDDKSRRGGKNKVRPNVDKLQLSFEQLTGRQYSFDFKSYPGNESIGPVDVLLIKPRHRSTKPILFIKTLEGYKEKIIWVRAGSEVVKVEPQHYANLFLSGKGDGIEGSIPPSTSQIRKFVGRVEAMSNLFDWLQNSDEPRTYLYGKGGSGKTTIAREFAKLIKEFGEGVEIEAANKIDLVLVVSAKEQELITASANIVALDNPDFYDEESLLRSIIFLSGGDPDISETKSGDIKECRRIVTEYLDLFSYLIIIDDIDTLTTKGVDPGADFLYRALSRAKKRSKILYTTRNAPSQSIHNSIEVPGLNGGDYDKFVDECVARFKTNEPSKDFREVRLPKISECRPLVIESIIALSRTSGGFEGAERLFTQNVGDNIRDYVFGREWDSLPDRLERPLLAALADLRRPTSFQDLKIVLQAGDSIIRDAIGSVREMFLSVDDAGLETLFSVAPLTKSFIDSRKLSLKLYPAIKERVSNFKKTIKISSPEVARVVSGVRRVLPLRFNNHSLSNLKPALMLVRDPSLSAKVTEDPLFRSVKGYVEAVQEKPNAGVMRDDFLYSLQMGHEPEIEELIAWFKVEKDSQSIEEHLHRIADTVIGGRRYSEENKISMISRKATTHYNFARQKLYEDIESSMAAFRDSLLLHLRAFKLNVLSGSSMTEVSERYAVNTADQWFRILSEGQKWEIFHATMQLSANCEGYLDPIAAPLLNQLRRMANSALFSTDMARIHSEAKRFHAFSWERTKWMDTTILPTVLSAVQSLVDSTRRR